MKDSISILFDSVVTAAICSFIVFGTVLGLYKMFNRYTPTELKSVSVPAYITVKPESIDFMFTDKPDSAWLRQALNYYGIKYADIVYAQAILETGHFKSRVCHENNNLFGLYDSYNKRYYSFDHWSDSVIAYRDMVQYKMIAGEDYYNFLRRIGYAEDPLYIDKLKSLIN